VTQALVETTPIAPPEKPASATLVRTLPVHDELRRLRQIRALRLLLERAAELDGEA
jgi:hypothetical protein